MEDNKETTLTLKETVVVMAGDPLEDVSADEMRIRITSINSTQELVDAYADAFDKFFYIEDEIYDFEKGTPEYDATNKYICEWEEIMILLEKRVIEVAEQEGLLKEMDCGLIYKLEDFMRKYGYYNGNGWWLEIEEKEV